MYVVFDMGATKTRVAASSDGVNLGEPIIFDTHQDYKSGMDELIETIEKAAAGQSITAIAGGVAGTMSHDHGQLDRSPNLPGWIGQPFKQQLAGHFDRLVLLQNDTALIGLGESTIGAGRDKNLIGYMTVSTGINGVKVVGGQIDANALGFELGYQIIGSDNGEPIRLEQVAGGHALEKKYGKHPNEIDDPAIWAEVMRHLAVGLHNMILHWSPELIILGGSMMHDIDMAALTTQVKKLVIAYPEIPEFRHAELGEKGGLLGALAFARSANANA